MAQFPEGQSWSQVEVIETPNRVTESFKGSGEFEFSGVLQFGGQWSGTIRSKDPNAILEFLSTSQVAGRIQAETLIVSGFLSDVEIEAKKLIAKKGARIFGRINSEKLIVEEGALIEGRLNTTKSSV